ncbi:MAG: N-formylglutamate amidohydrolase [Halioglobus sp.]
MGRVISRRQAPPDHPMFNGGIEMFNVRRRKQATTVFHIPHASTHIPPEIHDQFLLSDVELEAEIQAMTDHRTDDLFAGHGGVIVAAEVSRLVCDVERFLDDPMEAVGMGAIYIHTSQGGPLRRALSAGERQALLDRYYHPHHARLAEAVLPGCLIIDCHSFPGQALPYEDDQSPDRPDFCIGTDDYHTPPELAAAVVGFLESRGHTVWVNRPFAGTMVPARYYRQDASVRSIMIEVNRRLYLEDAEGFERARAVVGELVGLLC